MKRAAEVDNGAFHLRQVSTNRHEHKEPPPLPSSYSFGRSWARDQNDAVHKPHWRIVRHLVLWAVIAAVTLPLLLR